MSSIAENVKSIKQRVAKAAVRSGRAPEEVRLCAATKMNDAARVREAIAAGVDICGDALSLHGYSMGTLQFHTRASIRAFAV